MRPCLFVTGGTGLLGVTWATMARDGWDIRLGMHERRVPLRGVTAQPVSLESPSELARAFDGVSLVVHTAGLVNVEICEAEPERARHVNVMLSENVARASAAADAGFVHISTDHLFATAHGPVDESTVPSPANVYARTKAEAEQRVLDAHPSALVIRTNFYGWGPPYRPSFSDTIVQALRAGQHVTLFRDVFYTPIIMESLILAVHELVDRRATGIFHVAGDDHISKAEFGRRLADRFGLDRTLIVPCSITEKRELVARPRQMGLANAKATALLGRRLGGTNEHLDMLRRQETSDAVREIRSL